MAQRKSSKRLNPVEVAIRDIYRDTDGSIPDLSHLDHHPRGAHPLFIAGIFAVLLVIGASLMSIYIFAPEARNSAESAARLVVTGPEKATSGSRATYILTYANDSGVDYNDVELRVEFPDGFTIDRATPKATQGNAVWAIGALPAHGNGTIEISGILTGTPATSAALAAALTYAPANFHSSLVERTTFATAMHAAPLTLALDVPDQLVVGEEQKIKATYTNTGDLPLTNIMLRVALPQGGTAAGLPKQAVVDTAASTVRLPIGALGPGEEASQEFGVTIAAPAEVPPDTTAAPLVTLQAEIGFFIRERFYAQVKVESSTAVVAGGFSAGVAANGTTGKGTVSWDDTVTVSVNYDNRGKVALEDVQIRLAVDGTAIDWPTLVNPKGAVVKNSEVRWTKKEVAALSTVKPGVNGTVTFSVRLRASDDEALRGEARDAKIHIEGTVLIGKMGKATKNAVVTLAPVELAVNSDMRTRAATRYYNDDNIAVGTGPLPPKVGQATTYRVFLTIKNSLHELRAFEARATLPLFVEWTGKTVVGAGDIRYDATTRTVVWSLNRMPTSVASVESQFEVRLIPLPEHAKTTVTLVPEIVFIATDGVTQGTLRNVAPAQTTALPDDPEAKGKGIVVE